MTVIRAVVVLGLLAACNVGELVLADAPAARPDAPTDAPGSGLAITPTTHDYGSVPIGAHSGVVGFTVSTGSATGLLAVTIAGAGASEFEIIGGNCDGSALSARSPCTIFVAMRPTSVGALAAQLQVTATPGGTISVPLSGIGLAPAQLQSITPSTLSFGSVVTGGASAVHRFTVSNIGSSSVGPMAALLVGPDASQFELVPLADTCSNHANAPGASCTIDVRFLPSSLGLKTASLAISPLVSSTVSALSGTGSGSAQLAINPSTQDFGVIALGSSSMSVPFTIRNIGLAASSPLTTVISGGSSGDFQIALASNTCAGTALAPNATCTLSVRLTPSTIGLRSAQLDVGDGGTSTSASLAGASVLFDGVTFGPNPHAFGMVAAGSTSPAQTFTITNSGSVITGAFAVSIGGTDPGQFQIVPGTDHCSGVAVAPGTSCSIDVVFAPTTAGARTAILQAVAAPGGAMVASISGTGLAPHLAVSPPSHDFGTIGILATSTAQLFTITNTGNAPASGLGAAVTGLDSGQFTVMPGSDTCAGVTLVPSASCGVQITCTPTTVGAKSASLEVGGVAVTSVAAVLSCIAVSIDPLGVNPSILTFTNVAVGSTSAPQSFTLSNQGIITLGPISLSLLGPAASQYEIDPASPCFTASLAPGGSCTTNVRFRPTSAGTKPASVQVVVVAGGTVTVGLNGTAVP